MAYRIAAVLVVFALAETTFGETWKTPDGVVSVEKPDSTRFMQSDQVPGLSIAWISSDGVMRLGVVEFSIPPGVVLKQSGIEEGLANELRGKIVESRTRQDGPYTILTMTARGKVEGQEMYVAQAVVVVGTKAYKAMAAGVGKDPRANLDAAAFLDSFKVSKHGATQSVHQATGNRANARKQQDATNSLVDELSRKIGGISCILLLVALILLAVFRGKRRAKS